MELDFDDPILTIQRAGKRSLSWRRAVDWFVLAVLHAQPFFHLRVEKALARAPAPDCRPAVAYVAQPGRRRHVHINGNTDLGIEHWGALTSPGTRDVRDMFRDETPLRRRRNAKLRHLSYRARKVPQLSPAEDQKQCREKKTRRENDRIVDAVHHNATIAPRFLVVATLNKLMI